MNNLVAVDIGGTQFRIGLFDPLGRRLLVVEGDTSRAGGREWMQERIREGCRELLSKTDQSVGACGVSFGGPVDFEGQRVRSIHAPGWENYPLGKWFEETFGLPCRVDNDANAGALGEWRFGAGQGTHSLTYITLSTGMGGGLVLDGKVFHGKDGLAGEIGHIPVSDSGLICSCGGRGCMEIFCSGTAIALRGQEWAARRPEGVSRLLELSGGKAENISARVVAQAAAEGDSVAVAILEETARWLARALLMLIRTVNPEKIILGGGVAQAGKALLNPVREFLKEFSSPTLSYSTEILLAQLGRYSPLYGGAAMAQDLVQQIGDSAR